MKAGRSLGTKRQRSRASSGSRRALLVALYAALLLGTPFGHAILLSIHVATGHTSLPAFNEWFSARVRSTMLTVDEAYRARESRLAGDDHLRMHAAGAAHAHAAAAGDSDQRSLSAPGPGEEPSAADGTASGEHHHGDLIHSHASDLASELASLAGALAKHYFPPHPLLVEPLVIVAARAAWTSPAMRDAAAPVLTPPPRNG